METLLLTNAYLPIDRISWKRAMVLIVSGRAVVEAEYKTRKIHCPAKVYPMPSVIRFAHQIKGAFRFGIKFNRKNVWLRDKGTCQYCNKRVGLHNFTFEHVTPKSQGGKTKWSNIVVACFPCNQQKGSRTPQEAKMHILKKPIRPKSLPGSWTPAIVWDESMPPTWKDYLMSYKYWNDKLEAGSG